MPELPEVETVRLALEKSLLDHCFDKIQCNRMNLRYPLPINFNDVVGKRIITIRRRAKYLLLNFDGDLTLVWHLGMSGRVSIKADNDISTGHNIHDHVIFYASNKLKIVYQDARRFGFMRLMNTSKTSVIPFLSNLGPEPLNQMFDIEAFASSLRHLRTNIKVAILDQKIIAGVGNIYACEALWMAQISPFRSVNTLTENEIVKLIQSLQTVLNRAIAYGGSTLKDHVQPNGEIGYFQNYLNAYGRQDQPCRHCHIDVIKKIKQQGRSTYYCDHCQI